MLGVVKPAQQDVHCQFLCTLGRIAVKPCPLIRFSGAVGTLTDKGGIGCLFKPVVAEVVKQVQTVIGKVGLTLVFLLVVHYFGI